jgi:hypothetical protein
MPRRPAGRHLQREINGMPVLKQEVFKGKTFCLYALALRPYMVAPWGRRSSRRGHSTSGRVSTAERVKDMI